MSMLPDDSCEVCGADPSEVAALKAEVAAERERADRAEKWAVRWKEGAKAMARWFTWYAKEAASAQARAAEMERALREVDATLMAVLGAMQKPMERMLKTCALGLVKPSCDHDALRAQHAAMGKLDEAHASILALLSPSARPAAEEPESPCEDPDCSPESGWHAIGCPKRPPEPPCTCKMPIGFGRSFKGFMAPDPKCAFHSPACARPGEKGTTP